MEELSEERIIELDDATKQKVEATLNSIEDALKAWKKEKKKPEGGMLERMNNLQQWKQALKEWEETYLFRQTDDVNARMERLKAFYQICSEARES